MGATSFCAAARPGRVAKLRGHIAQVLRKNCLTPAAAIKLRGKLGCYASLLAGRIGRCMMGHLIARKYRQRGQSLDTRLRRNLLWRYGDLCNLPPRVTPYHFGSPVGAHTGAQGLGHIAAVFTGENKTVAPTHLPVWFTTMAAALPVESPVFIYGRCATILMARLVLNWSRDEQRTCVLRVENQAAVAALSNGSSSSPVGALLASIFWNIAARGTTLWWIEYVHAKSNDSGPLALLYSPQWEKTALINRAKFAQHSAKHLPLGDRSTGRLLCLKGKANILS